MRAVWSLMRGMRRVAVFGCGVVAIWFGLCAAVGVVAVEGALHPGRNALRPRDRVLAQAVAHRDGATLTDVAITAQDGAMLRAWSFVPVRGSGDTVILLHGQSDNRAGMLGNADLLLRHGFAVLLPDARAHGQSGGSIATYGVLEAGDLRRWFAWIENAEHPRCIDGLGDSMGAAQLMNSLPAVPGFCAVVAESGFSSFREAAYDRMGQEFAAGPWLGRTLLRPAVETGFAYARWKYGVDLAQAAPVHAVAATPVPVLLIHGLADTNLPPRHAALLQAAHPTAELWEPPGAGHCGASSALPSEYGRRVTAWFSSHGPR